jgi:holo-[acyl-carrier protein] synthase
MKIGIDIVNINRFKNIKKEDYSKWSKVYTSSEWFYAFSSAKSRERLAGIFASKEAAVKAAKKSKCLLFYEIKHDSNGQPQISNGFVSISHDGGFAISVVLMK